MNVFVPTYRGLDTPLHRTRPLVAAAWISMPIVACLLFDNPIIVCGAFVAVLLTGATARVLGEVRKTLRLALPLAAIVTVINPIVSREGLTPIFLGPSVPLLGRLDITLEATVYGAVAGLKVLTVLVATALFAATVDPDSMLRSFRRLALRSGLAAALTVRLVPVLALDASRMSQALALRADTTESARSRPVRIRRGAILTRALAAGALERGFDLAAALEVRGYGRAGRPAKIVRRWTTADLLYAASTVTLLAGLIGARVAGVGGFEAYPTLEMSTGTSVFVVASALPLAAIGPFKGTRLVERLSGSRIHLSTRTPGSDVVR